LRTELRAVAANVRAEAQAVDLLLEQPLQPFLMSGSCAVLAPFRNKRSKAKKTSWSVRPSSIAAWSRLNTGTPSPLSAQSSPSR
jgi:hypothetical protein